MLLLSGIFAAGLLVTIATMVGGSREKIAAVANRSIPAEPDNFDAPTLPLHRTMGLAGR